MVPTDEEWKLGWGIKYESKISGRPSAAYIGLRLRLGLLFFPLLFPSFLKLQEFGLYRYFHMVAMG
jgi:hypothetical protein